MPLPSGVTQTGPRKFVLNPGGHVLHEVSSLEQIVALRGAVFFFSNGSHVIIGGRDLDAELAGLVGTDTIGQLATNSIYALNVGSNAFFFDSRGNDRVFLTGHRVGAARTLTHVFGIEVGPFVTGLRVQSDNVAADQTLAALPCRYGLESVVGVTAQITGANMPGYTNPGPCSTNATGQGYNLGATAGTGVIITVPLGVTWHYLLSQFADLFPESTRTQVQEKLIAAINLVEPAILKISPIPCLHIPLRYVAGQWRMLYPVARVKHGALGMLTGLLTGASNLPYVGKPFTALSGGFSGSPTSVAIKSIDGRPIQSWVRGAHIGEQLVGGELATGGTAFTIQELLALYHNALTTPSTDNIPARAVVNGIPVSNATWGDAVVVSAQNSANHQSVNASIGNTWDVNGFSPLHALIMLSTALNAGEYSALDFVALDPTVFGPLVLPDWKPQTPAGWSNQRYNNAGFASAPGYSQWLATMSQ